MASTATQIPADEFAWAVECAQAGDTIADIAEGSGRAPDEWRQVLTAAGVICLRPLSEVGLEDRDALVAERYVDGVALSQIGREIGTSAQWVHVLVERLISAGVVRRRPWVPHPVLSAEMRERIAERARLRGATGQSQYFPSRNAKVLADVHAGRSYGEAALRFGISRVAVAGIVYRAKMRARRLAELRGAHGR